MDNNDYHEVVARRVAQTSMACAAFLTVFYAKPQQMQCADGGGMVRTENLWVAGQAHSLGPRHSWR